jgi:hypothetical protein
MKAEMLADHLVAKFPAIIVCKEPYLPDEWSSVLEEKKRFVVFGSVLT